MSVVLKLGEAYHQVRVAAFLFCEEWGKLIHDLSFLIAKGKGKLYFDFAYSSQQQKTGSPTYNAACSSLGRWVTTSLIKRVGDSTPLWGTSWLISNFLLVT